MVRRDCISGFAGEGSLGQLQDVLDGIECLQLCRTEQGEEDGVSFGPLQRAVLLADFACVHGGCGARQNQSRFTR